MRRRGRGRCRRLLRVGCSVGKGGCMWWALIWKEIWLIWMPRSGVMQFLIFLHRFVILI